jgi:hypothetical protein
VNSSKWLSIQSIDLDSSSATEEVKQKVYGMQYDDAKRGKDPYLNTLKYLFSNLKGNQLMDVT